MNTEEKPQRRERARKPTSELLTEQMQVSMGAVQHQWCREQEGGGPAYIRALIASDMARRSRARKKVPVHALDGETKGN